MAKSFSELRKSRGNLEDLTKKLEASQSKGKKEDDRFWSCQTDKAGNGSAILRFLPAHEGEDVEWVHIYAHGFQGPTGKWYIENSLTTLKQDDPVTELNNSLWESKVKSNEEIARKQKRKLSYYSNVYIVSDPANPENEGKVKIWRYGKKIFEKIQAAMKPEFEDDVAFNPFCMWTGANFRLKIQKVEGYANFDKSSFAAVGPLKDDDDELEAIWKQTHSLNALIAPDQFKTYDELKKRLDFVLAASTPNKSAEKQELNEEDEAFIRNTARNAKRAEQESEDVPPFDTEDSKPTTSAKPKNTAKQAEAEADDDLEYFRKLAEG